MMTLYHVDFIPRLLQAEVPYSTLSLDGVLAGPKYETFSVVVQRVNEWLVRHPTAKPIHMEVLEVDGFYGINMPEKKAGKDDCPSFPGYLKVIRLWYTRTAQCAFEVAFRHVLPARLESTPRSFSPKFQSLETMLNAFNEDLLRHHVIIEGPLLSFQTGMFRFTAQNCSLDPERMFWMVDSSVDDLHVCFYFTVFYCPMASFRHIHQIGFKDFAPVLKWKGKKCKLEAESISVVTERLQKWISEHRVKVINVQTIDHHAYYRCARDTAGYEDHSLCNPHFRSSLKGLMQFVKVMRLFHCTCRSCYDETAATESSQLETVIGQKSFHIENFIPISQINFACSPLRLPVELHTEYLSRINDWISNSGVTLMTVETSKMCLADLNSYVSAENVVFQSSPKLRAAAVYAVRLYVSLKKSSSSSLISCVDLKPIPRVVRRNRSSCAIL